MLNYSSFKLRIHSVHLKFHCWKKASAIQYGYRKTQQEYFPKHSRMGTARMKEDKVTEERGKREVSKDRSKAGTKEKISPAGLNYPNQNTIKKIICLYFIRYVWKRYNKIQLTKNKS